MAQQLLRGVGHLAGEPGVPDPGVQFCQASCEPGIHASIAEAGLHCGSSNGLVPNRSTDRRSDLLRHLQGM
jgi:hypothetical protein